MKSSKLALVLAIVAVVVASIWALSRKSPNDGGEPVVSVPDDIRNLPDATPQPGEPTPTTPK